MELKVSENITYKLIDEFEREHEGIKLFGYETSRTDFIERPISFNGDDITYRTTNVRILGFEVTGFVLFTDGVTVSCEFEKPVTLFEETTDDNGDSEYDHGDGKLEEAIRAKLDTITAWTEEYAQ